MSDVLAGCRNVSKPGVLRRVGDDRIARDIGGAAQTAAISLVFML